MHDSLFKLFESCGFAEVERHCIAALSTSQQRARLEHFYNYAFKQVCSHCLLILTFIIQGKVRSQDLMFVFSGTTACNEHLAYAWPFLKTELKLLLEKFGDVNSSLFQHCFKLATEGHAKESAAADVEVL